MRLKISDIGRGLLGNRTSARADQSDAKSFSSTTIYGKACEFDAVVDLEEFWIGKSLD